MKIQDKPHASCGAKTRGGGPCKSKPMANGRCRMHGGTVGENHGAPLGNQNGRKHGLFAKSLSPDAVEVYQAAKALQAAEIARDTAEFLVAKVAEAFRSDKGFEDATGLVREIIAQLVDAERITPDMADTLAARLTSPDLGTLGKVLSPLKGLLEVKKQDEDNAPNPGGEAGDTDAFARRVLEELGKGDTGKRGREA